MHDATREYLKGRSERVKDFREYLIARYGDDDKPIRWWSERIHADYRGQQN